MTPEMHAILSGLVVLPSVVLFMIKFRVHLEAFRKQMVAETGEGLKRNQGAFLHQDEHFYHLMTIRLHCLV